MDDFGCTNKDSVQIFLKEPLNIQASPGANVCEGGVVQLFATGGITYLWSPAEGLDNPYVPNPIASPAQTTSYTVTSTDGVCFTASDVSVVTINPQTYLGVSTDAEIVYGQNIQLRAYGKGTFNWSPPDFLSCTDCPNPTVLHPDKPMTYTVSVVDSNGCRREDDVSITLTCSDDVVYVPDAFTPNGDRKNDVFRVRSYGLQQLSFLRVFNRWGELVFETNDLNQGWDGTYKGQICSPAVFVWYLEGTCSNGTRILKQGNVTLIK
jgi:gliding motility-associated-like protein